MRAIAAAAAVILALSAGVASADQGQRYGHNRHVTKHHSVGHLSFFERVKIARSRARIHRLKARVRADGHVNRWERRRVVSAVKRHRAIVRKERRD